MTTIEYPAVDLEFDRKSVSPPADEMVRFVESLIANAKPYAGAEQRSERRRSVMLEVLAIPVDQKLGRCGEPFMALTRDISGSGICLYHTARPGSDFLAI